MILASLERFRDLGMLILRIGLGVMFIAHGAPKLIGGPEMWAGVGGAMANLGVTFAPAFWGFMAALSEAGGGVCLILGLAFRPACLLMAFTMTVATISHLKKGDSLLEASHAIELGVVFLGLVFIGPGALSIDKKQALLARLEERSVLRVIGAAGVMAGASLRRRYGGRTDAR